MGEELIPAPKRRAGSNQNKLKKVDKLRGMEMAAAAADRMENGEYARPGYHKRYIKDENGEFLRDENGNKLQTWNKLELMRIAGYSEGGLMHTEFVTENEYFQEMLELNRAKRHNPAFRDKGFSTKVLDLIGQKATEGMLEALIYYPRQLKFGDYQKAVKMVLDAGLTFQKLNKDKKSKSLQLLDQLPPEERAAQIAGYKQQLMDELEELEKAELANKGADIIEGRLDD